MRMWDTRTLHPHVHVEHLIQKTMSINMLQHQIPVFGGRFLHEVFGTWLQDFARIQSQEHQ